MRNFLFIWEGNLLEWGQLTDEGDFLVSKLTGEKDITTGELKYKFQKVIEKEWNKDKTEVVDCTVDFYFYIQKEQLYLVLEEMPDKTFKTIKYNINCGELCWDKETKKHMVNNNLYWKQNCGNNVFEL